MTAALVIFLWAWAIGASVGFWSCFRGWQKCNERWAQYCQELLNQRLLEHAQFVHGKLKEVRA